MNARDCCQRTPRPAPFSKRGREIAAWIIPGATLVLLPKCPMCIVAYVALFSGAGISMACASNLRVALLALCIGTLLFLALRRLGRVMPRKETTNIITHS